MTVTTEIFGYLEDGYLEGPYLTNTATGAAGFQAQFVILDDRAVGMQSRANILDFKKNSGQQARFEIKDSLEPVGMQALFQINEELAVGMQSLLDLTAEAYTATQANIIINTAPGQGFQATIVIEADKAAGTQALVQIVNFLEAAGQQANVQILEFLYARGFEVRVDKFPTGECETGGGYLEEDYLLGPYLTALFCTRPGMQARITIVDFQKPVGMQARVSIVDKLKALGMQARFEIKDFLAPRGMQAEVIQLATYGMQALATIYNTTNLRILCAFPSRGLNSSNWTSNSTLAGDFSVQNLDTDIVEQVWRSNNVTSGVRLVTDTGLPQGVFLDTLAILNHNLTKSANVDLIGSNDPTFTSIGVSIPLQITTANAYYIAPTLPTSGYRYWRLDIDDSTNPNAYLEIGTIVFGAAEIFQGECFVDELEFELKDFADTVRTEGFTNVANSRTQKRRIKIDFRSLDYNKRNFTIMRNMFEQERTTFKCLWIPTPSETDQEITARFAVFGKLATIPSERHNNKGARFNYVSFTADVDESL